MPQADPAPPPQQFIERLRASLDDGSLVRLQLGRPIGADDPTLQKLLVRPVQLRGQLQLSLLWRHATKDITKNLPLAQALEALAGLLGQPFHHAHLVTQRHDIQLVHDRKGRWALRVGRVATSPSPSPNTNPGLSADAPPTAPGTAAGPSPAPAPAQPEALAPSLAHDRPRHRALALETPFLAALGVTDTQHRLVPAMARKWRQINKFVEVLAHAVAESPLATRDAAQPVRVLDFGAGKGYLTFAVHHHLLALGRVPDVVGVELRPDLVELCNQAAAQLRLQGLRFAAGDVRLHQAGPLGSTDIMIALHACDTATDLALHRGMAAGAAVILCSPCCHKELRPQMHAPDLLKPMLRHGIHMAEQAEMLTDTLRALLLQAGGYDTQVFEFVSPEHTAKNKMLLAVRRPQPLPAAQRQKLLAEVDALKQFYGVTEQTLQRLLQAEPTQAG